MLNESPGMRGAVHSIRLPSYNVRVVPSTPTRTYRHADGHNDGRWLAFVLGLILIALLERLLPVALPTGYFGRQNHDATYLVPTAAIVVAVRLLR